MDAHEGVEKLHLNDEPLLEVSQRRASRVGYRLEC